MHKVYVENYHKVRHKNLKLNPYADELLQNAKAKDIPLYLLLVINLVIH